VGGGPANDANLDFPRLIGIVRRVTVSYTKHLRAGASVRVTSSVPIAGFVIEPGWPDDSQSRPCSHCDTVYHVSDASGSVQRSFRLSARTVELLDAEAEAAGESRNALADRLLGEALRVERHPLVRFHQGAAGRRQPLLSGSRLYVHQTIATLRASDGDVDEAATYLGLTVRQVRAAIEYYADFRDEVDADAEAAQRIEAAERERWERQQRALA
jgi:uncharacterized protein (DUF433 family)